MAANTPSYRLIPDGEPRTPPDRLACFLISGGETGGAMDASRLPDLSGWRYVEVWTLEETAMLWAAIDPADYEGMRLQDLSRDIPREQYKKAFMSLRAVTEAVCGGTLPFTEAWEYFDDAPGPIKTQFPEVPDPNRVIHHMTRVRQSAFLKWAEGKKLPSYRQQIIRAKALVQQQAPTQEEPDTRMEASTPAPQLLLPIPGFLDPDHPLSPVELRACAQVWEIVAASDLHERGKNPKAAIREALDSRAEFAALSNEAKTRITIVTNWNKAGGPPKTPGN